MPFDQAMADLAPDPIPPSGLSDPLDTRALAQLFLNARTHNGWQDRPVSQQTLHCLYELTRWGPTAANATPARFRFLVSGEAKERLSPHLSSSNRAKTLAAPVTAIIGFDLDFPTTLEKLAPRSPNAASWFTDPVKARESAFRSGSLQAGYFIIAARALGLDCGPISGFDSAGVDAEFFAGTRIETNLICNLGYGDPTALRPRAPRLDFEEAARIL